LEEQEEYEAAEAALSALIERYPGCKEEEMALLRSGSLLVGKLSLPDQAVTRLNAFIEKYPESQWHSYAEELLKKRTRWPQRPFRLAQ